MKSVQLFFTAALITACAIATGFGGGKPAAASTLPTLNNNQTISEQADIPIKVGDPIIIKDKKPKK
jgi:hypothetical protein